MDHTPPPYEDDEEFDSDFRLSDECSPDEFDFHQFMRAEGCALDEYPEED